MKFFFIKPTAVFLVMTAMLMGNAQAQLTALSGQTAKTQNKNKVLKKKTSHGPKAKFSRGSEETTAERSARLKRECFGGVNAGACAGYTH